MQKNRLESWLRNIQNTEQVELSCSECFDLVSHFIELELSGEDAIAKMPKLKQHLDQCSTCRQEYETLRDLQQLENMDELPSADDFKGLIP